MINANISQPRSQPSAGLEGDTAAIAEEERNIGWERWLDGKIIAGMLEEWQAQDGKQVSLIFGMLNTKEPVAFLKHLAPLAQDLSAVAIPGDHASLSAEDCVGFAKQVGLEAHGFDSVDAALKSILAAHGTEPRCVLICGSLYLAGTVLAENGRGFYLRKGGNLNL